MSALLVVETHLSTFLALTKEWNKISTQGLDALCAFAASSSMLSVALTHQEETLQSAEKTTLRLPLDIGPHHSSKSFVLEGSCVHLCAD